ncbi:unnamed protein product [Lactuca saligna]|uniref:Uncharacterized protein n=1 Tax=Lactuca saligna TaxID=75948 RepID=A0AA35ZC76_LACSI|nr:unnamed protein product [Lactuca saligna]
MWLTSLIHVHCWNSIIWFSFFDACSLLEFHHVVNFFDAYVHCWTFHNVVNFIDGCSLSRGIVVNCFDACSLLEFHFVVNFFDAYSLLKFVLRNVRVQCFIFTLSLTSSQQNRSEPYTNKVERHLVTVEALELVVAFKRQESRTSYLVKNSGIIF